MIKVPAPIKNLFDSFPLVTFNHLLQDDTAIEHQLQERSYAFEGPSAITQSRNHTITLAVYNVNISKPHGTVLAGDPWCLFTQLSLCKKNGFRLPQSVSTSKNNTTPINQNRHSLLVVSLYSSPDSQLPILIEGFQNRITRSTMDIHKTMNSRSAIDPIELIYINLLDTLIYDVYMAQLLFSVPDVVFLKLFNNQQPVTPASLNPIVIRPIKLSLALRNGFSLRNSVLYRVLNSFIPSGDKEFQPLISALLEKGQFVLLQFQQLLNKQNFLPTNFNTDNMKIPPSLPSYLDLKLASYVLSIEILETSALQCFVADNCQPLIAHANRVVSVYR